MSWFWGAYKDGTLVEGPASTEAAFYIDNPGVVQIAGPFASERAADLWGDAHPHWPKPESGKGGNGGGSGGGSGTGSGTGTKGGNRADVVQQAINSIGHPYLWDGSPGADGSGAWDCSSCTNDNFGRVNGLSIPGFPDGSYDGMSHGPSTLGWLAAQGTIVGSIDRSQAEGGDIACWRTHMGTFINSTEMVSAANPAQGTIRSGVDGFIPGEQLVCLRMAQFGPGGITLPTLSLGDTKAIDEITRQIAKSSQSLVWKRMQIR